MDQLIRETQPPAGTLRSPVPQYWNPDTEKYERVLGVHGAPRAMLYGPNGQPISTSNRLPVDVGAQVATESTLAEAVSRLNAILTRLEGTLDVDVGGQIHADVDLGDVTVQIGEVQQGKRGQNAEPWEVTLTGSDVTLPVSDKGGKNAWFNFRTGNVAPNTESFLLDRPTQPAIIDSIEFLTNNPHRVRLRVYSTTSSGTTTNLSRTLNNNGTSSLAWTAEALRNYRPDFHVLDYNEVDNVYRFIRTEPWVFPKGVKIGVQNTDPSNEWIGALLVHGRDL